MTGNVATLLDTKPQGHWRGTALLYRVDPPMPYTSIDMDVPSSYMHDTTEFVIVSAVTLRFPETGDETYIFPADADGNVLGWEEIKGSMRGTLNHAEALAAAGYTTINSTIIGGNE